MFDRPLLRVDANCGRYLIARHHATTELSFVFDGGDGAFNWSALGNNNGMSNPPWDEWIMAGRLPSGTRKVDVKIGGSPRIKTRSGLWIAAVRWDGQEHEGELVFSGGPGSVVECREMWIPRRG